MIGTTIAGDGRYLLRDFFDLAKWPSRNSLREVQRYKGQEKKFSGNAGIYDTQHLCVRLLGLYDID